MNRVLWLEGFLMLHMFLPVSISFERLEQPCLLFSDRLSTDGNSTVLSAHVGPENVTCICFKQETNVFAQDTSRHCWVILGFTQQPLSCLQDFSSVEEQVFIRACSQLNDGFLEHGWNFYFGRCFCEECGNEHIIF